MKTIQKVTYGAIAIAVMFSLGACSGMSSQERSTAIGAGAGALGGAIITGGSAVGTVGGAAIGGVVGHEVAKPK